MVNDANQKLLRKMVMAMDPVTAGDSAVQVVKTLRERGQFSTIQDSWRAFGSMELLGCFDFPDHEIGQICVKGFKQTVANIRNSQDDWALNLESIRARYKPNSARSAT